MDVAAAGSKKWAEVANTLGTRRTDAQCKRQWETAMIKQQRAEEKARARQATTASQTQAHRDRKSVGDSNENERRTASQVQVMDQVLLTL